MMHQPLLLRAYANLYAMFHDLLGVEGGAWEILRVFQSFGFFMAMAFLAAAYFLQRDLKRKEKLGIFKGYEVEVEVGHKATPTELVLNGILGALLGYKLIGLFLDLDTVKLDPQAWMLSSQGSLIGAIIGAAALVYSKYREKEKEKLDKPKKVKQLIMPHQMIGDIVMWAAIGGIGGAKLFYLFETPGNFASFMSDPLGSFFGGLTIYGGLIGGTVTVIWFAFKRGLNILQLADSVTPTLFLAYGVGRMGCQVAGDGDWGIDNLNPKPEWLSWLPDWAWAYDYAHNVNNEGILIPGCTEQYCHALAVPVFPTPLYEIVMAISLFALLWSIRTKIKVPGIIVSLYLILNGIERFTIEQIRINTKLDFLGMEVTQAEIIAVVFVLTGIAGLIGFTMLHKKQGIKA